MIGLAIAAGIGASINATTFLIGQGEKDKQYTAYKRQLQAEKAAKLQEMDAIFDINQKDAFKNADRSDAETTLNEGLVALDFNNQLGQLGLQQEAEAFSWNRELQAIGAQKGEGLAAMAQSGTRTSSASDAVDMQAAQNAAQLQLEEDTQRRSDTYAIGSLLNGLQNNIFNLQSNRTDALDLRTSWSEGGDQFNLFQLQRKNTADAYDRSIEAVQDAIDDTRNIGKNIWGTISAGFGGAMQGMDTYAKVSSYLSNAGSYSGGNSSAKQKQLAFSWNSKNTFHV